MFPYSASYGHYIDIFMTIKAFKNICFLTSAAKINQCPPDIGAEVAFIGRSNAGKSSALNAIVGIKKLARTSKTPGRTQLLNFFSIDDNHRLVDLPGYGYAEAPEAVQNNWQQAIADYLEQRQSLKGLVLLMDIRHPLKETDQEMLYIAGQLQLPVHVLLTKADKLSRSAALKTLEQTKIKLRQLPCTTTLQLFSAHTKLGVEEMQAQLLAWLELLKNQ